MSIRDTFLEEVAAFVSQTGMAEGTLAGKAVKDSRFVQRVRNGKGVSILNIERVRDFMDAERKARAMKVAS